MFVSFFFFHLTAVTRVILVADYLVRILLKKINFKPSIDK